MGEVGFGFAEEFDGALGGGDDFDADDGRDGAETFCFGVVYGFEGIDGEVGGVFVAAEANGKFAEDAETRLRVDLKGQT